MIQYGRNASGTPQLLMCGVCDKPAVRHTAHELLDSLNIRDFCDRGMEEDWIPSENLNDYYWHGSQSLNVGVTPYVEFTGNEANVVTLLNHSLDDEYDNIVAEWVTEQDKVDHWRDTNPDEHTHATSDWIGRFDNGEYQSYYREQFTPGKDSNGQIDRTVFIEGQSGFHTEQVYDPDLTNRYALRLLNVFTDKTGQMRCGGVKIVNNIDGTITAKCVNDYCPSTRFTVNPETMDREAMEDFVLTVIRHGNNHAASWFRNRIDGITKQPTFYKIHTSQCNLDCDPNVHYCSPTKLTPHIVSEGPYETEFCSHIRSQGYCVEKDCQSEFPVSA